MAHLAQIWRYPIKSIGRERLGEVSLQADKILPFDRHWAVTHARTHFDAEYPAWAKKINFLVGFKHPELQAITSSFDEATAQITLAHPAMPSITQSLNADDTSPLLSWLTELLGETPWEPRELVSLDTGLGDQSTPLISINSLTSLADFSEKSGHALEVDRWRGNLWIDGMEPWEEFKLIGKDIQIGEAVLNIIEPVGRCNMTMANPQTGEKDFDSLGQLRQHYQHTDFGVFARVIQAGQITEGAKVTFL